MGMSPANLKVYLVECMYECMKYTHTLEKCVDGITATGGPRYFPFISMIKAKLPQLPQLHVKSSEVKESFIVTSAICI